MLELYVRACVLLVSVPLQITIMTTPCGSFFPPTCFNYKWSKVKEKGKRERKIRVSFAFVHGFYLLCESNQVMSAWFLMLTFWWSKTLFPGFIFQGLLTLFNFPISSERIDKHWLEKLWVVFEEHCGSRWLYIPRMGELASKYPYWSCPPLLS